MTWELCDLHTHVLPGMDDGCKTPEESVALLKLAYGQGVRYLFATHHYYPVEPVGEFLRRRDAAWNRLQGQLEKEPDACVPKICLGAEVAYRPGLGYAEDIHKLCIGSSRYLLLELPFSGWNRELVRDVRNMCAVAGITPILAHIERYLDQGNKSLLHQLLELDVLVQMNAGSLLRFSSARKGRQMLKSGMVQLLGSDCHNMRSRQPNLGNAVDRIQKHCGIDALERIAAFQCDVLGA